MTRRIVVKIAAQVEDPTLPFLKLAAVRLIWVLFQIVPKLTTATII